MRAPSAAWAAVRGVVLRAGSDTGGSLRADDGQRRSQLRSGAPAVLWPERFREGSLREPALAPSARRPARSGPAALSSVHLPARSFCLSVSGAVAPSAPSPADSASPARVGANLGNGPKR